MISSVKYNCDEDIIKELCVANCVSYENIAQDGIAITSLEVFFFSRYPRMVGLSHFSRLCKLTIVKQNIRYIEGLECCPLLRELWVVGCQLRAIDGLQDCLQLQKLYLYDNKISEIENLELHLSLQVLWLNNNCIHCIQGLDTIQTLRELNVADNKIEKIGHSLDANVNLHILNLAGNKIASFKELTYLARLPQLEQLGLQDSLSSPNPVCLLCNYATHVLYHMPGLQILDNYDVTSKQVKEAAESTVLKKMMYYHMRVHTAQRTLAETQSRLKEQMQRLLRPTEEHIRAVTRTIKDLELELWVHRDRGRRRSTTTATSGDGSGAHADPGDGGAHADPGDGAHADPDADAVAEDQILSKILALTEWVKGREQRMTEVGAWYERELSQAADRKERMVHFLSVELETVGNIRFEEGSSKDPWFTSCRDLVLSRFTDADYKVYGVTGIKISSIIRVHNRALRLRFEDKLLSLISHESGSESGLFSHTNYKRWLEYLFYVPDPEKDAGRETETLYILEEGFPNAEKYKALGRENAVPLANSLSVAEALRVKHALPSGRQSQALPFRYGHVIVSKVFLGRSFPLREGETLDASRYPKAHCSYRHVNAARGTKTKIEGLRSAKTPGESGPVQSQWFVFDHELVLPEYIVYFEYVEQDPPAGTDGPPPDVVSPVTEVLNMEPVLPKRPKLFSLEEKTLLEVARANVLSQITVLNLHGNHLSKLKEISCLIALRRLTISFNEVVRLDDISNMPKLEFVDASYNHITTLDGLKGLGRLKQLDMRWNKLTKARNCTVLRKHAPALLKLDTRHNPWLRPDTVRSAILGRLVTLTHLDEVLVTEEEVAAAARITASSRINMASLLANSCTDRERPRSLSLLSVAQLLCQGSPARRQLRGGPELGWTARITALSMDRLRISKLTNFDKLINLRWASFNHNDISVVEGLDHCLGLEELSLNDNYIVNMDGLAKLHSLTKLSLNRNQLSCLDASVLERLPNLHFLSVENNRISSVKGIQRARALYELYIGNNLLSTSRDIYHLKVLTNLVILELHGNPLVKKLESYRIYMIFLLPALNALDGSRVEVTESENAKDVFGGRLTPDMVAEKLGHANYLDMGDLTLRDCSIRMVDLTPIDLFLNLQSVNLEHNNLTSFSGLVDLPKIKALHLNNNHIESILPRPRSQARLSNRQILNHKVTSSGYGRRWPAKDSREPLEPLMGSLEVLHLSYNGISNMANLELSRLTNLRALFLKDNEISQVEGLEGLHRLRELDLDKNRIKALGESAFASQRALLQLRLVDNRLRTLGGVEPLIELRRLVLDKNKIEDIAELEKLDVLPALTELSVVDNPVAKRSLHRPAVVLRLSGLQVLDSVTVSLEERARAELLTDPLDA